MKILSIGSDKSILKSDSPLRARILEYGGMVEAYTVMVPWLEDVTEQLSERVTIRGVKGWNKAHALWRLYQTGKQLIKKEGYTVVTVQDPYFIGFLGLLLTKRFGLGLEIQVHGWYPPTIISFRLARLVVSQAQVIRVVSERLKKYLQTIWHVPESKIIVASVFTPLMTAPSTLIKRSITDFIFLTVGRLIASKNIHTQLKALSVLIKNYPQLRLWIVGDGPERINLETLVKKMGLVEKVIFWGWKEKADLAALYESADAFLFTSESEGWGLVAIEAAQHALPIIMTDVGCAGEVIINEESGLIIAVRNQEQLVGAMERIATDEILRKKLQAGTKIVAQKLPSKAETLAKYLDAWKKAESFKL